MRPVPSRPLFAGVGVVGLLALAPGCVVRGIDGTPVSPGRPGANVAAIAAVIHAEASRTVDDERFEAATAADPDLRRRAVRALGRIGDDGARPRLVEATADADGGVRAAAVRALGSLPGGISLDALRTAAEDPDPAVRAAAADVLATGAGAPARDDVLSRLLDDGDADVRIRAATAAGVLPVGPDIVTALVGRSGDDDPDVRLAAMIALADLALPGSPVGAGTEAFRSRRAARDRLLELATDPSSDIRAQVARGLAVPISPSERSALVGLVADRNAAVRAHATRSLAFPGSPLPDLALERFDDPDLGVVAATFDALGAVGGMDAYRKLATGFLKHRDTVWLLPVGVRALFASEPDVAVMATEQYSAFPQAAPRAELCRSLGKIASKTPPSIKPRLETFASADVPEVREAAVEALEKFGAPLAELPTRTLADGDPRVRAALARAARARLQDPASPEIRDDAVAVLASIVPTADDDASAVARYDWITAAGAAATDPRMRETLVRVTGEGPPAHRALARDLLGEAVAAATPPPPPAGFDAAEIARWAARPRAAIVTVERPGFAPGRFVIALDVDAAPMAGWRFARLAAAGEFDGVAFDDLVPGVSIRLGDPADPRFDRCDRVWPAEPADGVAVPAGAVLADARAGGAGTGPWSIAFGARTERGAVTRIGRVVQNLSGVAARLLPGDRIVSIRIVEGDGTAPLPPAGADGT